ncbi:MAG TPA: creatininase [Planctomycetaceae bacterium]|jgi:creatinine amidohydrolase|nr:amidase [Rhodopirellula sp.]MBF47162.1 amidase [Euryarchaeota archaeon]MCH2361676.1 creatininase family protein [Pirellulales bacterium]HAL13063.1 creatininase [Planctomycetaceae bacterium]HCK72629.1 creatininase [Planctomycetaceae bacterium]|tara:strand:+ start:299 stop:1063 length:765 start_codon:yes stop_codon:yes gene_type:complete
MIFQELTSPDIKAIDRENTICIIPIAAVEQHGPHMPTGTDTILCTAVAEALEAKLPEQTLLTPTSWLGASAHHLRIGATLNADLDHYVSMLLDIGKSLLNDGFRRIFYLNGHGGNIDPMKIAVRELQLNHVDSMLVAGSYWAVADDFIVSTLEGDHKYVGHACEFETSMIMHVRPELVRTEHIQPAGQLIDDVVNGVYVSRDMTQRTNDGFTGRPDLATAEKGEQFFNAVVDKLVETVSSLLTHPLGTTHQDFI